MKNILKNRIEEERLFIINQKIKYDDNSRQTEGDERTQEQLSENNNFLYNISNCNLTDNWTKH